MARPISTSYTEEQKDEIIAHVLVNVACGRYVSRIFREDEKTAQGVKIPAESTFWLWLFQDATDVLSEKLARAREFGIEAKLDEVLVIAETTMPGDTVTEEPLMVNGQKVATLRKVKTEDMLGHRRLLIETTFKAAQMLKPKKYGAKLDLTSGGERLPADEVTAATRLASIFSEIEKRNASD